MGQRESARRVVGVCLLLLGAACADKTPAAQRPQAATAPLTTPVVTGVPAGPPVQLMAAATARPFLLGTVAISSVDRLLNNGTKLVSQAMPLPMDAVGLRDMILSQAGLPPEVSANIDFASPSAAAFVRSRPRGRAARCWRCRRAARPRRRNHRCAGQEDHDARSGDPGGGEHGRARLAVSVGQHRRVERRDRGAGPGNEPDAGGAPRRRGGCDGGGVPRCDRARERHRASRRRSTPS